MHHLTRWPAGQAERGVGQLGEVRKANIWTKFVGTKPAGHGFMNHLHCELSEESRCKVLRFAASFLWADCEVAEDERRFLTELGRELSIENTTQAVAELLCSPPNIDSVDPRDVEIDEADLVRAVALRAIASDGKVKASEMVLFELLDDLLPRRG